MDLEIYQVDSFTTQAFKGNPAGVCISQEPLDESLMFSIAEEMAVSETAFLSLNTMTLKWFTPQVEVKLCGHGTLATVHVMKEKGLLNTGDRVVFNTLSGELSAAVCESSIELDFPSTQLSSLSEPNIMLLEHLGLAPHHVVSFREFDSKQLIEVSDEQVLLALSPNFDALKGIPGRGVVVTALASNTKLDFVSRYFAPWVGVNEDPVTGSAHCALTQHWADKLNKNSFSAYQASRRGGYISTGLLANGRIKLIGSATTVTSGVLKL
ncbi:PhzF family phenazine biosynthesis protein [Vibrio sp. 10N.261.46.E12]|uniref:PhzF family phenazine biosynthesis protein n=1 Tax=unclassified Vibrio TaxID=2614977 RepID=UPI000975E236|nr:MULTISPECIES: PhzF family phenazine biosynthesis protein [unclassified Vibrio]OMO37670.1 phenazine biosynthesis protein PhzF [Vibrio sp. 10N.261.45.E1]PMJ19663.1 phenazine biosynthesis protein PhzF [Vibrio sp. 10N.286.45.B6]PML93150.1 phenazine biosynthesis protein PhzF [Vibrio sp. 10N.261.49.E11]PMM66585.1 phenazine biosynthesis protein PhzF [Vibrio sp. 10N.261.46.F12]PMM86319.1 phenazine biosynthesis protein PhzF [Vibrio sp. 10N.261.46.E8]